MSPFCPRIDLLPWCSWQNTHVRLHHIGFTQIPQGIVTLRYLRQKILFTAKYIEGVDTLGCIHLGNDIVIRCSIRIGHAPYCIMSAGHLVDLAGSIAPTGCSSLSFVVRKCAIPCGICRELIKIIVECAKADRLHDLKRDRVPLYLVFELVSHGGWFGYVSHRGID